MHGAHKLLRKFPVNHMISDQHKFHSVTGGQVKYFRNAKLLFYLVKLIRQILLAYNQFPQLLQLNLFMRKSDYL